MPPVNTLTTATVNPSRSRNATQRDRPEARVTATSADAISRLYEDRAETTPPVRVALKTARGQSCQQVRPDVHSAKAGPSRPDGGGAMTRGDTQVKTRQGDCPTHGTVEGTKEVPAFSPPGLFYIVKSLGNPLKPFRCPQCGARVS